MWRSMRSRRTGNALSTTVNPGSRRNGIHVEIAEITAGARVISATSMNSEVKVRLSAARETVAFPSSNG
jgi:hypothetical protein